MISKLFEYLKDKFLTNSRKYWEERYRNGEDSGIGSYSNYAKFKSEYINDIIKKYNIKSITELGCGDGNNLTLYNGFKKYYGYDVSETVINRNNKIFPKNKYSFKVINEDELPTSCLYMSLDVIYHLVETSIFNKHIEQLFGNKSKYVLIYSSNFNSIRNFHVRHRRFTDYIPDNYKLIQKTNNSFKKSSSLFFLYERNN